MFGRKKKNAEENEIDEALAEAASDKSEPIFGGAAVDNHRDEDAAQGADVDALATDDALTADEQQEDAVAAIDDEVAAVADDMADVAAEEDGDVAAPAEAEGDAVSAEAEAEAVDEAAEHADDIPVGQEAEEAAVDAAAAPDEDDSFPAPRPFDVTADSVPVREDEREGIDALPTGDEDAFEPDGEEFLQDAESFIDDSHTDYYTYGEKVHNIHDDAVVAPAPAIPSAGKPRSHARHRKPTKKELEAAMPEHQKRSRKTRRVLIVVAILLIAAIGALGYWAYQLFTVSQETAVQQTNTTQTDAERLKAENDKTDDATSQHAKVTDVPVLTTLIGLTQDEAVEQLAHGAAVSATTPLTDDAGNEIGANATVLLTDEPADSKSGTPSVYLVLNADGIITQAGYSAATASLGYGSLSFVDAVTNEYVVEKTLTEAGVPVQNGSVELPDKSAYTTYASDGTTRVTEKCSFDGVSAVNGQDMNWSAVLLYDYTAANTSGNLADTVRQITVYVSLVATEPVEEEGAPADAAEGEETSAE